MRVDNEHYHQLLQLFEKRLLSEPLQELRVFWKPRTWKCLAERYVFLIDWHFSNWAFIYCFRNYNVIFLQVRYVATRSEKAVLLNRGAPPTSSVDSLLQYANNDDCVEISCDTGKSYFSDYWIVIKAVVNVIKLLLLLNCCYRKGRTSYSMYGEVSGCDSDFLQEFAQIWRFTEISKWDCRQVGRWWRRYVVIVNLCDSRVRPSIVNVFEEASLKSTV